MSLFIGNISKSVTSTELEKLFGEYGSVRLNYKGSYAFAEFDHEKDAEEALENLQNKDMAGRKINIEWSKKSRKFDDSKSNRRRRSLSSRSGRNDGRCFNCNRKGHYMRDCKSRRRHSRSRSRSRSRRRRSSSRDRRHRRRRSPSSRSRSNSYRGRKGRRSSSRSSSSSRSRRRSNSSRDKSPYEKKRRSEEKKERSNNYKQEEKKDKRESRSRSRDSEEKNLKNLNKIEKNDYALEQILDKDMISEKYKNDGNTDKNHSPIPQTNGNNVTSTQIEQNNSSENIDFSKMKTDDLKSELKRKGISYSRHARKSELIDLLKGNK